MSRTRGCAGAIVALLVAVGCSSADRGPSEVDPFGPATVQLEAVADHASQFDDEVPVRVAGSQQEQLASTYLLGHLQQAGYTVRLEAVPVANTIKSTDVLGLPPSGNAPVALVVVAYDTPAVPSDDGTALGLFLELARALRVVEPLHEVEFAALGAEHSDAGGGALGSRRLVRLLMGDDLSPPTVAIEAITLGGESVSVGGTRSTELIALAEDLGLEAVEQTDVERTAFAAAGWGYTVLSGDAEAVGRVLLAWLGVPGSAL